ncbi:helix-turn-helix domain-containing protein [Halorussus halophilus]|uniref:helix-turn-helix domain-containing protein n=1 Tax=Halorussus halophilus TaxID=2650975 RepID=UPI0013010828|nr:helix-turn-helix domain-containing protein [Halorussus halophilus]
MTTVAEISVPAEKTALHETFETLPELEIRMEHIVGTEQGEVMPFVWVSGASEDEIERALQADSSAGEVRKVDEEEDAFLYKLAFTNGLHVLAEIVFEKDGTILEVQGHDEAWRLLLRFPDRKDFADAYEMLGEYEFEPELLDIHSLDADSESPHELTDEQYEILQAAHEMGHYDVPRDTTLESVADRLDISRQAASERLRRAHREVIDEYLTSKLEPDPDDEDDG